MRRFMRITPCGGPHPPAEESRMRTLAGPAVPGAMSFFDYGWSSDLERRSKIFFCWKSMSYGLIFCGGIFFQLMPTSRAF